jgi:hypothetical protein
MVTNENRFARLSQQARAGDVAARGRLLMELQPCLARIAQRALAQRAPAQPVLTRRLVALTHRLAVAAQAGPRQLGHTLAAWVVDRVLPGKTASWDALTTTPGWPDANAHD